MAKITNSFTSYDSKGNREKLLDKIYNVDPLDTPMLTLLGKFTLDQREWSWQTERLPVASTTPVPEGNETARKPSTPTVRERNVIETLIENATVSGLQDKLTVAGKPGGEMNHQLALITQALKIAIDKRVSGDQPLVNGSGTGAGVAAETRGVENWITTNVVDAAGAAFDKDMIEDLMQALHATNGTIRVKKLVLSYGLKRAVAGFTPRPGTQVVVKPSEFLSTAVSVFLSDSGELMLIVGDNHTQDTVLGIAEGYGSVGYVRTFEKEKLGKIGDAETWQILSDYGVQINNERAFGKIINVG